ncbi:MAG: peptidyl-prolyl cis-trans isomerase [Myxococcaceae bacterium]|nr:peptidyl-prolyl cis-trans isomerase [Myxococcaceae bacterium]
MRMHSRWTKMTAVAVGLCAASGCNDKPQAPAPEVHGEIVATVGDEAITREEFEAKLAEQPPFIRTRLSAPEKKKEFLENQVRLKMMAQEAMRRGLESDPEVREMIETLLVQQLVKAHTESPEVVQVSDTEAKAYYEANLSDYVKPERVRISQLVLTAPRGSPERQKARARAAQLIASVQRSDDVSRAFDAAVRAHSQDTATQALGGELGFRTREELEAQGGAPLAESAFALKTVGQLSAPVETDQGVHVLMLQARQLGSEQSFEQAMPRITQLLRAQRRAKALDELVQALREKTRIEVKEDVLSKVDPGSLAMASTQAPGGAASP